MRLHVFMAACLPLVMGCGGGSGGDSAAPTSEIKVGADSTYVFPDAVVAIVVNVKQLQESPAWESNERLQMMGDAIGFARELHPEVFEGDLKPSNIRQLVITAGPSADPASRRPSGAFVVKLATPHSGRKLVDNYAKDEFAKNEVLERKRNGQDYFYIKPEQTFQFPTFVYFPDDMTLVVTQEESDMHQILDHQGTVKTELTNAMSTLNTANDVSFIVINNDHTQELIRMFWGMLAFGVASDLPDHLEKAVIAGSLPPNAEYKATLTFKNGDAAQKLYSEIQEALKKGLEVVTEKIKKTEALPDGHFNKTGLAELKQLLENLRVKQSGVDLQFHVEDVDDIDLYAVDEAFKSLMWNSGDDNDSSEEDPYGTPSIESDPEDIESTIKD